MNDDEDKPSGFGALRARLRDRRRGKKPPADQQPFIAQLAHDHSRDAVMTLVAIMKDEEDPRLQIAAAKALLDRGAKLPPPDDARLPEAEPMSPDDIDDAIAIAKKLLDELATRKAGGVAGAGKMASDGAASPDHA